MNGFIMKLITLIENAKVESGLKNEFGLSLYLEANDKKILFDTGSSSAFAENASRLGVDLAAVDLAVLSHSHYDHGGGLEAFFRANSEAPLYLRPGADGEYVARFLMFKKYVGLDQRIVREYSHRMISVDQDTEIAPGLHVLTNIPSSEPRPHTEDRILVKRDGGLVGDDFRHELALVVEEGDGVSVLTGCGHRGILNMLQAARSKFPDRRIKAAIGGFHMIAGPAGGMNVTPQEARKIAQRFKELGCEKVISAHCTGKKASKILKGELKEDYSELRTGAVFNI
jgi:7,8-dihydropterin-6-yl-methyl-4-(beta-D-ribofuranosyl)aminobenzene 5'-phosphate synthase